jgi:hypothetical protein
LLSFFEGEGDLALDIHDLFASPARDISVLDRPIGFVVGNGGTGGTSVSGAAVLSLTTAPLTFAFVFIVAPESSTTDLAVARTSGLDFELGSHERFRSIMDFLRLVFSFFAGTAGAAVVVEVRISTMFFSFDDVLGLGLSSLTPDSKRSESKSESKSNSKSSEGTSKAGRLGRLLRLRVRWSRVPTLSLGVVPVWWLR